MRIEPPPSLPWAAGTIPEATAAAEPPLEPPAERSRFQGLRVGPKRLGSVVAEAPSSGVFVRPMKISPAARSRSTRTSSKSGTKSPSTAAPEVRRTPARAAPRSLSR